MKYKMELEKILKVQFLNQESELWSPTAWKIVETNIEFEDLLKLINHIESHLILSCIAWKPAIGIKNLHKEAFDGVDFQGNVVKFSSYVIWQVVGPCEGRPLQHNRRIIEPQFVQLLPFSALLPGIIYKYNFDENLIPFSHEILRRSRNNKINGIFSSIY